MNDLDQLTDRLHELGRRAPVPNADPLLDIRRGRTALRQRRRRGAAGMTALVAVGAAVATVPTVMGSGGTTDTMLDPAGSPASTSPVSTPRPTPAVGARDRCTITGDPGSTGASGRPRGVSPKQMQRLLQHLQETPEVTSALTAYRDAASEILDPSGKHLDPAGNERSDNVQSSSSCDPIAGEHLTSLGTKIGWRSGGALGVVQVEVVSTSGDDPQVVMAHPRWTTYDGKLPDGVDHARVIEDQGTRAVVAERADGLTVAVDAEGVWGNNAAPSSPAAGDLPSVERLLTLAADQRLILPAG